VLAMLTWALRALLVLVVLNWAGLLLRTVAGRKKRSFHVDPLSGPPDPPLEGVSVVVPARNEETNLGPCLERVLAQEEVRLEVVVLDDGSSDGTAEVLARFRGDARLKAVPGVGEPPAGWFGKPWALQRAQAHATQPWLVFLDADVRLEPGALAATLSYAREHGLGMLSGFGTLTTGSFWERVLQPVVGGLIVAGNDLGEVNDPARLDKAMANGQLLLFSRAAYDAVGQHAAVRRDVLDDVGLARAAKQAKIPFHMTFMRAQFSCRMYEGLGDIWRGWRKNLFAGMHYRWGVVLSVVTYLGVTNLLPWLLLILGAAGLVGREWLLWGTGLVLLIHGSRAYLDLVFHHPLRYGPTQPLGVAMAMLLMLDSAWSSRRGRVSWKGRAVDVARAPEREG